MGINLRIISRCSKVVNIWISRSIRSFNKVDKPLISNNLSVLSRRVFFNIKVTRPCVISFSHWDRYLGMMTAMTQVPVPTTVM